MNHQSNWEEEFEKNIGGGLAPNPDFKAEVKSFIASAVESAREEGRREERREILAAISEEKELERNAVPDEKVDGWQSLARLQSLITSRKSSEGGKCCEKCNNLPGWENNTGGKFFCTNPACNCHAKKPV
jgi:hypothetical protein